ncbi:IS4 family transposase [Danxiaibacter flavus]|uniref:IS4 family transposase n=1 Tax=Danxiaibacter flavus TaxID=3049108 RepID=A0ABV3ZNM3_9BACT|nr:IS4 family transposase [Chitinophagaceae bacterium DXS]
MSHLMSVAKQTGFVKRMPRKINPRQYIDMLLFSDFNNAEVSLNDHSIKLNLEHKISIRKQSLNERFNTNSVEFIKTLLSEQIKMQMNETIDVDILKLFTSVKIKDSTRFQLPPNLKEDYPGCGGGASEAGMHIQFEFDVKSGQVSEVKVGDALQQDVTNGQQTIEQIQGGSLIIRDLGYFSTAVLQAIEEKDAHYISRLQPKVKMFELKGTEYHELDLKKEYRKMKRCKIPRQEKMVYIGGKTKLFTRIVIELLPEAVVENRIRKASRETTKKGRQLSKEYIMYASFNLFITNVSEQILNTQQVHLLYQLRWQIELRFKCWKSLCEIQKIKKMKKDRFETYLYARLLYILINWKIAVSLNNLWFKENGRLLSIYKCFKAIMLSAGKLREALFNMKKYLHNYLQSLYDLCRNNLVLEKRKNHLSFEEILLLIPETSEVL